MVYASAHVLVDFEKLPLMTHATYSEKLQCIIGLDSPGLIPGGDLGSHRGVRHIHCASEMPDDKRPNKVLAGFRGKIVECYVSIDNIAMHRDRKRVCRSAAGVLLCPQAIAVDYILWVQFLPLGQTIYKRAPPLRFERAELPYIECICCQARWRSGTWICLRCWEPLHFGQCTTPSRHSNRGRCRPKSDDASG